jgi:hypothetical protein
MTEWDPNQFINVSPVAQLANSIIQNRRVDFPDGTHITKEATGFALRNRAGMQMGFHDGTSKEAARSAAQHALDASAGSRHPKSLGGRTRYASARKVKEGKPLPDTGIII